MEFYNSYIFLKPDRNDEESFYYFIKNSKIKLISDSSAFSFVYKCSFKKSPEESPYYYLNSKKEESNVTEIAIKCLLLNDRNNDTSDDDHYWYYKRPNGKESKRSFDVKSRFEEEVIIQTNLSKKTVDSLNRNVPVVLFAKIFENSTSEFQNLYSILSSAWNPPTTINPIKQMIGELERKNTEFIVPSFLEFLTCFLFKSKLPNKYDSINYYFGFIAMEYIPSDYKTFCDIIKPIIMDEIKSKPENKDIYKYDSMTLSTKSKRLRWMYNTARYDVLRLAIDTGYSQGDYHTDNILIDEKTRRCMIIDFGKAKKIYNDDNILNLNIFENTNDVSNIEIILDRIFYTTFDDDKKSDEFMWLKNIDEIDIGILLFLHENRMTYIENQTFLNPL